MTSGPAQFCSQCGYRLALDARFCARCGTALTPLEPPPETASSPHPAGLLPPVAPTTPQPSSLPPTIPAPDSPGAASSRRGVTKWLAIGAGFFVVVVAGLIGYRLLTGADTGMHYVAVPDRDNSVDIYAVKLLGDDLDRAEPIAEGVNLAAIYRHPAETGGKPAWGEVVEMSHGPVGVAFDSEDLDHTLVSLDDDLPELGRLGSIVHVGHHSASGSWRVSGAPDPHGEQTESACYTIAADGSARRVARGQRCSWSPTFERVAVVDQRGDAWDLLILDVDGEELLAVEDVVGPDYVSVQWSASGDRLAVDYSVYEDIDSGFVEIYSADGEFLHELDVGRGGLGFGDTDIFMVLSRFDAVAEIHAFMPGAQPVTVETYKLSDQYASVYTRQVGDRVAVAISDGPSFTVTLHDVASGESTEVVDAYSPSENYVYVPWEMLPDGRVVALIDGRVVVGDVASGVREVGRASSADNTLRLFESPDGTVVLLVGGSYGDEYVEEVAIYRLNGDALIELADRVQEPWNLSLSADGTMLAYSAGISGERNIYAVPLDGSAGPEALDSSRTIDWVRNVSWDGDALVYSVSTGDRASDSEVRRARLDGSTPEVLYEDAYLLIVAGAERLRTNQVGD